MKYKFIFLLTGIFFYSCTTTQDHQKTEISQENEENMVLNENIDWNQFQNDLKYVHEGTKLPLNNGVFPVPEYESSGNGNIENKIQIGNHQFIQQSVFVYQGDYNTSFFDGVTDPDQELIYFTLLVKTTHQDSANQIMSSSRNHPTYLSQGIVHLEKNQTIKWLASHNSSLNNDMAIVNMKHFDLTKGRLIIVIPMQDGSLRFTQINVKQESIYSLGQMIQKQGSDWHAEMEAEIRNEDHTN